MNYFGGSKPLKFLTLIHSFSSIFLQFILINEGLLKQKSFLTKLELQYQFFQRYCSIYRTYQCINIQIKQKDMDLDYPSEKKHDISKQVNKMDRRYGSIIISNPRIQLPKKNIPSWVRNRIIKFIENDMHANLLFFMEQQAINIRDQISQINLGWNILHFCCKFDASLCVQNLLRHTYQQQPKNYIEIINSKTREGDTPIIISCQYFSNHSMKCLLDCGGVDIYMSNLRKAMPYQIAFSENNQQALKLLMKYEVKIKEANLLNIPNLSKPVQKQRQSCCPYLTNYLLLCLGVRKCKEEQDRETETDRKMITASKNQEAQKSTGMLEICWLEPEQVYSKKINLFSSLSSPFAIRQGNIIVSHLLIVFQWLAYYPELLKNLIIKRQNKFEVHLFKNHQKKTLWIDSYFPYFKQTQQPLFLSLNDQLWPMILQKALSQFYNGYFEPGKIPLESLLQTVTGNLAFKIITANQQVELIKKNQFNIFLSTLDQQNCIHILKPSSICPFKTDQRRIQCFSIIKRINGKYLINCPFICEQSRLREQNQTRQMKMHKAHFLSSSGTLIWIQQQQFSQFFQEIIFCHTFNPLNFTLKKEIKLPTESQNGLYRFYFRIKIPICHSSQDEQNNIVIGIKAISNFIKKHQVQKPQQKHQNEQHSVPISKIIGWSMKSQHNNKKISKIQKIQCNVLGIAKIPFNKGDNQILLECQINKNLWNDNKFLGDYENVTLYVKADLKIQLETLDNFIGELQFIQCCKNYFNNHHQDFGGAPVIEIIGDHALVLIPTAEKCHISLQEEINEDDIIQGCLSEGGHRLDLLSFEQIQYAIVSNCSAVSDQKIKFFTAVDTETTQSLVNDAQN